MSMPNQESADGLDRAAESAAEQVMRELESDDLDFIPDDPAELRRAVAGMAARINLADWRFVKLIAAMDRARAWREGGYCSLGNWLDHRCGLGPCAARERIRIARALEKLPRVDAAFRDGTVSYSKVRAVTRVATRETEAMLLAIAEESSAASLESLMRTYERTGGAERKRVSSERRRSLTWHYEDGMLVINAALPAERGALVVNALQKVVDGRRDAAEARAAALLGMDWPEAECGEESEHAANAEDVSAETASGDGGEAVRELAASGAEDVSAESPAGHGFEIGVSAEACAGHANGNGVSAGTCAGHVHGNGVSAETDGFPDWLEFELASREQRWADALADVAEHYLASGSVHGERRRSGRRYEVVLTISRDELAKRGSARCHVDPDWGVDEEDARHIACDADITEYVEDAKGNLLNYERRRRIVPARLLRALKLRDKNRCRFPGCSHRRYVEAHHVRHWIDGGETRLDNLVLLCGAHHRLLHHGAYHIEMEDGDPVFVSRDGEVIPPALNPQFGDVSSETSLAPVTANA